MIYKSSFLRFVLAGLLLSALSIMAQTTTGQPTTVFSQQTLTTGMVPLGGGQTAQLNVLNLGTATCFVEASFLDANGNTVYPVTASASAVPAITAVAPNKAQSFDFTLTSSTTRAHVRGVVKTEPGPIAGVAAVPPVAPCTLMITMETFVIGSTDTVVFTSDVQAVPTLTAPPAAVTK